MSSTGEPSQVAHPGRTTGSRAQGARAQAHPVCLHYDSLNKPELWELAHSFAVYMLSVAFGLIINENARCATRKSGGAVCGTAAPCPGPSRVSGNRSQEASPQSSPLSPSQPTVSSHGWANCSSHPDVAKQHVRTHTADIGRRRKEVIVS